MLRKFFLFIVLTFLFQSGYSQQIPPRPDPPHLVNDFTNTLSASEITALEAKLVAYNDTTSTQITVVIISTLDGYPISQFAFELGDKWGVGRKQKDNGAVILVAKDDREVFIATGRGLEGPVPDALAKRIIEKQIIPAFRANNFYGGLDEATTTIMKLASGEFKADNLKEPFPSSILIIVIIIILIFLVSFISSYRKAKTYAKTNGIDLLTAWQLINNARRIQSNKWNTFNSGSGSFKRYGGFNSGSSGGFGGFGGGSFGGGGAGGKW